MAMAKKTLTKKKNSSKRPKRQEFSSGFNLLEQSTGKPASKWTIEDIIGIIHDYNIRMICLMHVGGDGCLKTLDFVPRNETHLREIVEYGERADGSSIFAGMGIPAGQSDIVLRPRIDTAFIDPFAPAPTLAFLCHHFGRDGNPLPESPDTILDKAYYRALKMTGIDLYALGEVEYFLGKLPEVTDFCCTKEKGYHAASPFVFGEALRREALIILTEIGVPVKYGHSEVGIIPPDESDPYVWEQHEIELALQPLPKAADSVVLVQWVLRNLAQQSGMRCNFEPLVRIGHAGSGMHFHLSAVVRNKHLPVYRKEEVLNDESKWILGGLVQLGGVLMAFGNRSESSFKRLSQGKEAPNTVTWGRYNRKALVRIPITTMSGKQSTTVKETIEYRLSDGSANPQLLLAGIAQAVIHGKASTDLDKWLEQTAVAKTTGSSSSVNLPKSFTEIAHSLERNRKVFEDGGVFPPHFIQRWIDNLK